MAVRLCATWGLHTGDGAPNAGHLTGGCGFPPVETRARNFLSLSSVSNTRSMSRRVMTRVRTRSAQVADARVWDQRASLSG